MPQMMPLPWNFVFFFLFFCFFLFSLYLSFYPLVNMGNESSSKVVVKGVVMPW